MYTIYIIRMFLDRESHKTTRFIIVKLQSKHPLICKTKLQVVITCIW